MVDRFEAAGIDYREILRAVVPDVLGGPTGGWSASSSPSCARSARQACGHGGRVTPELIDRIVDPTTGRECGPGEEGEVCVKGPSLMLGYYQRPEATAEKVRDGWTAFVIPKVGSH